MSAHNKPSTERIAFARHLRAHATDAERLLWSRLRAEQLGHKFRRQFVLGPYVADFVCLECRLVIEVDGGQHAESASDVHRDAWLQSQAFRVIRFWNNDVMQNMPGVLQVIWEALQSPPPQPSPVKGEGANPPSPGTVPWR